VSILLHPSEDSRRACASHPRGSSGLPVGKLGHGAGVPTPTMCPSAGQSCGEHQVPRWSGYNLAQRGSGRGAGRAGWGPLRLRLLANITIRGQELCRILDTDFRESRLRNCLKSPDSPKMKASEAYETGQKGFNSLLCATDICTQDTTERLFRQSLIGNLVLREYVGVKPSHFHVIVGKIPAKPT
jgi:hypothetical protein